MCRAGFQGNNAPFSVFPQAVAETMAAPLALDKSRRKYYVGDEGLAKRSCVMHKDPVVCGLVNDWDAMEQASRNIHP